MRPANTAPSSPTLPAPLLARIYGEHGQRLLERNVCAFLQAKGKVNRGLQKTLREEPHRFLAYNNGLCCTAAEVKVKAAGDGHARIEWVRDFQIVNGGQTTASIYHALKKEKVDVTQVVVQVKLTVLSDPAGVAEIVPLISQYANSQNKVKNPGLYANRPFHRSLELLSRRMWAPAASGLQRGTQWYYERAAGSYLDDKAQQTSASRKRDWEQQNPAHQKFTKTDLAKFEHFWKGLPHLVCMGSEKNFKVFAERMEEDGEPVVDENYFKQTVAKAILHKTAEKLFSTLGHDGYRAESIAYALAWLAQESKQRLDLDRIWQEQRVPPLLCEALKIVSTAAHGHLLRQGGNVREAAKREPCWREFAGRKLSLPENWRTELAAAAFVPASSEEESLAQEWERLRHQRLNDARTIGELEAITGLSWVRTRRGDPVYFYAERTWEKLRALNGLGLLKIRGLMELFAAAPR